METRDSLKFWKAYEVNHEPILLVQYLESLIQKNKNCLEESYHYVGEQNTVDGPHLFNLPDNLLKACEKILKAGSLKNENISAGFVAQQIQPIVIATTLLCRNFDNIPFVSSCDIVSHIISIAFSVVIKLTQLKPTVEEAEKLITFLTHVFHFLEVLYDPYRTWIAVQEKKSVNRTLLLQFRPSVLHVEVIPFFYDFFHKQASVLPVHLQTHLLRVFGSILSGAQHNALTAITPATLQILSQILTDTSLCHEAKLVGLQCIAYSLHIINGCSPDQRQIEVSTVMENYMKTIVQLTGGLDAGVHLSTVISMLDTMQDMLCSKDELSIRKVFQDQECLKILVNLLRNSQLCLQDRQQLVISVLDTLTVFISRGNWAKKHFLCLIGFDTLCKMIKSIENPSQELILAVLRLASECKSKNLQSIRNAQLAVSLLTWLPDFSQADTQVWTVEQLLALCELDLRSRFTCCQAGMVRVILRILEKHAQLGGRTIGKLLRLLEILGSHSLSPSDLKQMFLMLRLDSDSRQFAYTVPMIHTLSTMTKQHGWTGADHFFDFQDKHNGIAIHSIRKWPGTGFSFHIWLRLDKQERQVNLVKERRQLYSFLNTNGGGFEAFFTEDLVPVVASVSKKEYCAAVVPDCSLDDGNWHSVSICHSASRRPFSQSMLNVYVDGRQRLSAQLKFPSISEPLTYCRVGMGGQRTNLAGHRYSDTGDQTDKAATGGGLIQTIGDTAIGQLSTLIDKEKLFALGSRTLPHALRGAFQQSPDPAIQTCANGGQDSLWGSPHCLQGQVGSVCVFHEALSSSQIALLYLLGPNCPSLYMLEESSDLSDTLSKLVLYWDAKAYADETCMDLSETHMYDGQVSGRCCKSLSIKESVNCLGGMAALFPLLENASRAANDKSDDFGGLTPQKPASTTPQTPEELNDEWVVLPSSSYSEWRLEQNQVAAFLLLVLHMLPGHLGNQEQLLSKNGFVVVNALLQKIPPDLVDVNMLMATQLLVEGSAGFENSLELLRIVYHYILFDFRIWSKGSFPVRIGHIQYLSTVVKDDRKYFRKKYGPQYLLDSIQMFYSSCDLLSSEDVKTIRVSLLGLVKYYISREINFQEVQAIIGFLITVKEEEMLQEVLEMLLSLLDSPTAKDQFFLLLYEPGGAELLYCLLLNSNFSTLFKATVLKVISVLLKTEKVYDKSKVRLRLHDLGFNCLTNLLSPSHVSLEMVALLMDQTLMIDNAASYQAALSMLHFIRHMEATVKLDAIRKFLSVLKERNNAVTAVTKQIGWQECLLSVLIRHPISGKPVSITPIPSLDLIDLTTEALELENDTKPGSESPMLGVNTTRRLSRRSSSSQRSLEETGLILLPPRTPQFLMQLKEHIFDFDFPNILGRSRSGSQSSSIEDLSGGPQELTIRSRQNSGSQLQPSENERCLMFLPDDGYRESNSTGQQPLQCEEELFEAVTEAAFLLLWKGVEGSSKQAWQERGMVFACINLLALSNELYKSHLEVKRKILELALEACLADLTEAGQANVMHSENAIKLMEIVFDFIVLENDDSRRISERLLEEVLLVLDVLLVFEDAPGQEGWLEMAEMGLGIVLVCAGTENLELCAMATAKLHALVQTRPFASVEEACHLLATLDNILTKTLEVGDQEHYSFLIPVVRALLEKISAPLHLKRHLPTLQLKAPGPAFFEDFQQYALNFEWKNFIEKVVRPLQNKYAILQVDKQRENMNLFWNQCYEATMIALHKRRREMGESKLKFQSQIGEVFHIKVMEEQSRYQTVLAAQKHQLIMARKRWRMLKLYLYGPRGPWESRSPIVQHWKLSPHENLQRMRLKLTFNFTFDSHYQASRLRDNQGMVSSLQPTSLGSLPPVAREARVAEQQEDSLLEEDLQASTAAEIEGLEVSEKEKTVIAEDCELVTLMSVVKGRFEVSTNNIYFLDLSPLKEEGERQDFKWPLSQLREVHLRRYNLRRSALEFFLVNQTNFFLNFNTKMRNKIYIRILSLRPPNLQYIHGIRSPAHLLRASGFTQKWIQREISNFEYLMQLNTIAGRTYNDLSQYPVFPWILCDYVSEELDLDDPAVYRDLSKPIGVANPKNIPDVKAKFDNFVDITGTIEKFHYGTHYSNSAGVLHYLVRLEPFTSLHVELQTNRFDVADRQFHSLEATWRMLMENCNDVKELIPEFFFLPEFLINMNGFDLGRLQGTKERVDSVKLPPWASSPEEFIYKHRKALESEYVSSHLHEWIDLIFGYKQKGPAAVDALNVFYYVSYEGAVDLDAIEDPAERAATEGMINNFGQTPCQLLKEAHPKRMAYEEATFRMSKNDTKQLGVFTFLQNLRTFFVEVSATNSPVIFIRLVRNSHRSYRPYASMETLVTVCQNGTLGVHGWLPYDKTRTIQNYYTFERDPSHVNNRMLKKLGAPFYPDLPVSHKLFVLTPDGKLIISGGHWDKSLKIFSLSKSKTIASITKHSDIVTCLALDYFGGHLISGSRDTTCIIWELTQGSGSSVSLKPMHILCGHDDEVSCVAISMELHMAISGSKDGTVNIHTVQDGYFMRTLSPPCNKPQNQEVSLLGLSSMGYICLYCQPKDEDKGGEHCLQLYSINGKHLYHRTIVGPLTDLYISGDYMVTGSYEGVVGVYELFGLQSLTSISLHIPVMAVCVTHSSSHVLASLDDGKMIIIGVSKLTPQKSNLTIYTV